MRNDRRERLDGRSLAPPCSAFRLRAPRKAMRVRICLQQKFALPLRYRQRKFTGRGYDDGDIKVSLVGIPILKNNWREQ
ncbi:MAG: hypothetical protein QM581_16970 [Pseudomonas sp.]